MQSTSLLYKDRFCSSW